MNEASNQTTDSSATPSAPSPQNGVSLSAAAIPQSVQAGIQPETTGDTVATPGVTSATGSTQQNSAHEQQETASLGVAPANGSIKSYDELSDEQWASLSDAEVKTVSETRLYLFDVFDIFLQERWTQKLVTPKRKLAGRLVPKQEGGGRELKIAVPTIDAYAREIEKMSLEKYGDKISHKWHGSKAVIETDDRIFEQLREVARTKSYQVSYSGDANNYTKTPQVANEAPPPPSTPDQVETGLVEPIAETGKSVAQATPPPALVPREMYDLANLRANDFLGQLNAERSAREADNKRYEVQHERLADQLDTTTNELASVTKRLTDIVEKQPSEILSAMRGVIGLHPNGKTYEVIPPRPPNHPQPGQQ